MFFFPNRSSEAATNSYMEGEDGGVLDADLSLCLASKTPAGLDESTLAADGGKVGCGKSQWLDDLSSD